MRISRRALVAAGAVVAVTTAAAALATGLGIVGPGPDATASATPSLPTTAITRQTLRDVTGLPGTLDFGAATPITSKAAGTVTWLPPVGATLGRGDAVLRSDDEPVVLLYGTLPAYRTLADHVEGRDVRQFEENLWALGYRGFTVDERYTGSTVRAVEQWQRDLGLRRTGAVTPGDVVYAPGRLRVAEQRVLLGAQAAGEVLTATGTTKIVTVDVPVADAAWAVRGARVRVLLPSGRRVAGRVAAVGTEASSVSGGGGDSSGDSSGGGGGGGGSGTGGSGSGGGDPQNATVSVTVSLADQRPVRRLERAPVQVEYTSDERRNVLTVPVVALLALAEGGYGVEVAEGTGTHVVAVRTGLVADGRVEISGTGLRAGARVVVPG